MHDLMCPQNLIGYSFSTQPLHFNVGQTDYYYDASSMLSAYSNPQGFVVTFMQPEDSELNFSVPNEKYDDLIISTSDEHGHSVQYRGTAEQMRALLSDVDFYIDTDFPSDSSNPDHNDSVFITTRIIIGSSEECGDAFGATNSVEYHIEE